MKIWLKILIALIIGVLCGIFLRFDSVWLDQLLKFLSNLSINSLFYLSSFYIIINSFIGFYNLIKEKIYPKMLFIFMIVLIISLVFSTILSIGIMNFDIFQKSNSFRIFQIKEKSFVLQSFGDILLKTINKNIFSVLIDNNIYILPLIFIAFIFSISSFLNQKKSIYFVEVVYSTEQILNLIIKAIIEIFPIGVIFITFYLIRNNFLPLEFQNIVKSENINYSVILKPLLSCILISVIIILIFSIFLKLILKINSLKILLSILGASLISLTTGNNVASLIGLNEHLKKNTGIEENSANVLTPLAILLNRSGTIIVSTVILMTLLYVYHSNIITFYVQVIIFFLILLFSFRLDGMNDNGYLILVGMILHSSYLNFEENSYLLFYIFTPVFSRIAATVDTITSSFIVVITTALIEKIEEKRYIEFI